VTAGAGTAVETVSQAVFVDSTFTRNPAPSTPFQAKDQPSTPFTRNPAPNTPYTHVDP